MSNIQVVVRCRGRNHREVESKSPVVVELPQNTFETPSVTVNAQQLQQNTLQLQSQSGYAGSLSQTHSLSLGLVEQLGSPSNDLLNSINSKTYTVDQVYGPMDDQQTVYQHVALPLFNDFINGFNVSVLAYGQTGTGKTYTMCGETSNAKLPTFLPDNAGLIPRILHDLFKRLNNRKDGEGVEDYVVKCSFVELYNEDLKDLLAEEDNVKLKIYESKLLLLLLQQSVDTILIQNLKEEYLVDSKSGLKLLQRGISKRKTASTKLNDVSSRSHTIFTINLYRKVGENQSGGGSGGGLFRISKMNLVDLAGSENVSKSGAINQRAKEAGSINQSLLALGRVINSLSEKDKRKGNTLGHIPYRESKLTRLLQDSIGGQTKTALIATISPAKINTEETISTLEYASRAKNIQNKPQLGQDSELMIKKILLKDMAKEISKLNNDLIASRSKNGVWLDDGNYRELIEDGESMKTDLKELRATNNSYKYKIDQQSKKLQSTENELSHLRKQVEMNKLKLVELEEKTETEQRDIKQKHKQEIMEMVNKLKGLENLKDGLKGFLKNVVDKTIQSSVGSIGNVLDNLTDSNTVESTTEISKSLKSTVLSILQTGESIKRDVDVTFQSDIPKLLSCHLIEEEQFSQVINKTTETIKETISTAEKSENVDLLMKNLLSDDLIDKRINEVVEQRLSAKMEKMNSEFLSKLSQISKETFQKQNLFLNESLKEVSKEIVSSERSKLLKNHKTWCEENKALRGTILGDVSQLVTKYSEHQQQNSLAIRAASKKISKLVKQNIMEPGIQRIIKDVQEDGVAISEKMENFGNKMAVRNESNIVELRNIQNELTNVRLMSKSPTRQDKSKTSSPRKSELNAPVGVAFDFASPTKISSPTKTSSQNMASPLKSPSRMLSPSRATKTSIPQSNSIQPAQQTFKTPSSLQFSKIPQLTRASSTEKENVKRRRI